MSGVHHTFGDGNVLIEGIMGCIDHHRTVEAGVDAVIAGFFITMVKVNGKNRLREDFISRTDDGFEHLLVGVFAGTLGDLDNERGLRVDGALEESHSLLGVVDVVGANGILAIGVFEELSGRYDHKNPMM